MIGTCSGCKKPKQEVQRVAQYQLCQSCWAQAPEQIRLKFPVFKLTLIQKARVAITERQKQARQSKRRQMTTKEREKANRRNK
jgi:hypothetical protein